MQPVSMPKSREVPVPSPLVFFTIGTSHPEQAQQFYGQLFGWRLAEADGPNAAPSIDPEGPGDFDVKGAFRVLPEGAPPSVTLFFRVSDLWATVEKAQALGAALIVPIRQTPAGAHLAIVRAPDGASVGIVQA
jgi:predicted enzyme related to lactoylglutathione lyase